MFQIELALLFSGLITTLMAAQTISVSQPTVWATKPDVAAFEKIENDRLAAAQASIVKLLAVQAPRIVDNTLAPFDEAIRQMNAAENLARLMEQVHPDATFRDHGTAMLTKVSAAQTAVALNRQVYNALVVLDLSHADSTTRYYVQRLLQEFRLAGVDKDDATRARLKELNQKATELRSAFERNIAEGKKSIEAAPAGFKSRRSRQLSACDPPRPHEHVRTVACH